MPPLGPMQKLRVSEKLWAGGTFRSNSRCRNKHLNQHIAKEKKVGSSNQNETRKEQMLRDMPPLGPMQKKSHISGKNVGWGYFSLKFVFVQVEFF